MPQQVSALALLTMMTLAMACADGDRAAAPRAGDATGAGPEVAARPVQVPCRRNLEAFLAMGGLRLADIADLRIREDRLAGGQPGEQVGHWHVMGKPSSCASGRIEIVMLADCAISDWTASGGCRIPGLEPAP